MSNLIVDNEFYCTQCGKRGLGIVRQVGKERAAGHLKKLWCPYCNKENNFVEIKPFVQKYTYNSFLLEFNYGNFNEKGERKQPFGIFKDSLIKKGINING